MVKIVIAGGGSVGRFIAEQLVAAGHGVCIVDNDAQVVGTHRDDVPGVSWVQGDACDLNTLESAGILKAEVLAAVTGDDEDNLVVSLLAKTEFAVPRVLARVNNPKNEWMFDEVWGVDIAVSTPHVITGLLQEAVVVGSFVRLMSFERGHTRLAEVTLATTSPAADARITDLSLPADAAIVAVVRDESVIVPTPETLLRVGDEVLVLVTDASEGAARRVLVG
ncbi:MAG: hypothetical protein RJB61_1977 [Actinomycetota bacterium]|jgi:trk system potassium uptake protein